MSDRKIRITIQVESQRVYEVDVEKFLADGVERGSSALCEWGHDCRRPGNGVLECGGCGNTLNRISSDESPQDLARAVLDAIDFPVLVEALSDLLRATDPYVEDASPPEQLNGLWAHRFSALSQARVDADAALGGVRVSGRADRGYRMALSEMRAAEEELRLQGSDESAATLRSWLDRLAAVDGETTTTKGGE